MRSEWREVTIEEVATIKHGFAFKGEYFTDVPQPSVLLTPGNFAIGGGFQTGKPKYYCGPIPIDYVLAEGDLVVTMTDLSKASDTLGYAARVPKTTGTTYLHNQRTGLVQVKDSQVVQAEWLHYLMRTQPYRSWVIGSASGTTVKHTSPSRIGAYAFKLPPIAEQLSAAQTLDAIQSRIDLLRQTNTTLEAIVQALFKSWFVDFDPVHAKADGREPEAMDAATAVLFPSEFEDSELGPIPKGWRVGCIGDLQTLQRGFDLPASQRIDGEFPIMAASGPSGHHREAKVTGPGVTTGRSGVLGRVFYVTEDFWPLNTSLWIKDFKVATAEYAYQFLKTMDLAHLNAGSAVPTLNRNHVHGVPCVVPDVSTVEAYTSIAAPLLKRVHFAERHALRLSELRDTLLPRLISGKLRLPEATEAAEAALA